MADFIVEEIGENRVSKTSIQEAVYSGNFHEYIISKSHSLDDSLIIADMFSNRDGVDVINASIDRLVFKDCVKNFNEIYFDRKEIVTKSQNEKVFKFDDFEMPESIKSIKILINGFDEFNESASLDLQLLPQNSKYKYKITSNTIEILIFGDFDMDLAKKLLASFVYEKKLEKSTILKEIYVIIDEKLFYEISIKF